jgi:hypothetical protein
MEEAESMVGKTVHTSSKVIEEKQHRAPGGINY